MQSAQTVSAAYDFDLAARDYALADRAIEPVSERLPCSAFKDGAKLRAYLLRPIGSAAREETCCGSWQILSRFARARETAGERDDRQRAYYFSRVSLSNSVSR